MSTATLRGPLRAVLGVGADPLRRPQSMGWSDRAVRPKSLLEEDITMHEFALLAGSAAAAIFMIAQLPMLIKACRTKNLASYSFANIGLANLGNLLYSVYVIHVPVGPVWAIHLFNQATSGLMLFLYLRYRGAPRPRHLVEATLRPLNQRARSVKRASGGARHRPSTE